MIEQTLRKESGNIARMLVDKTYEEITNQTNQTLKALSPPLFGLLALSSGMILKCETNFSTQPRVAADTPLSKLQDSSFIQPSIAVRKHK